MSLLYSIAWAIALVGAGLAGWSIVHLARRRKELKKLPNYTGGYDREMRKWHHRGTIGYMIVVLNAITFVIAGAPLIGVISIVPGVLIAIVLSILGGGAD